MNIRLDTIFAVILFAAFFMPWIGSGFMNMSGYNMARLGQEDGLILYAIPALAGLVVLASAFGNGNKLLQLAAGVSPFILAGYAMIQSGAEIGDFGGIGSEIFRVLGIGIYLTVISAICLILLGLGIMKNKSITS